MNIISIGLDTKPILLIGFKNKNQEYFLTKQIRETFHNSDEDVRGYTAPTYTKKEKNLLLWESKYPGLLFVPIYLTESYHTSIVEVIDPFTKNLYIIYMKHGDLISAYEPIMHTENVVKITDTRPLESNIETSFTNELIKLMNYEKLLFADNIKSEEKETKVHPLIKTTVTLSRDIPYLEYFKNKKTNDLVGLLWVNGCHWNKCNDKIMIPPLNASMRSAYNISKARIIISSLIIKFLNSAVIDTNFKLENDKGCFTAAYIFCQDKTIEKIKRSTLNLFFTTMYKSAIMFNHDITIHTGETLPNNTYGCTIIKNIFNFHLDNPYNPFVNLRTGRIWRDIIKVLVNSLNEAFEETLLNKKVFIWTQEGNTVTFAIRPNKSLCAICENHVEYTHRDIRERLWKITCTVPKTCDEKLYRSYIHENVSRELKDFEDILQRIYCKINLETGETLLRHPFFKPCQAIKIIFPSNVEEILTSDFA